MVFNTYVSPLFIVRFGELGEYLLVTPRENERLEKAIGMVPIRISVVVTLRELQPLAARGMMQVRGGGQVELQRVAARLFSVPSTSKQKTLTLRLSASWNTGQCCFSV
jgi:hypothetical protein